MDHSLLSLLIGCTALLTSAASLRHGLRNREENKKLTLTNKKTKVLEKVYERRAKLGHLALVVAQQLKCYADNPELKTTPPLRFEDASKNIEVVKKAIEDCKKFAENVRQLKPTDIEPWEDMLATSSGFLLHVKEDIEKEKIFLNELRELAKVEGRELSLKEADSTRRRHAVSATLRRGEPYGGRILLTCYGPD